MHDLCPLKGALDAAIDIAVGRLALHFAKEDTNLVIADPDEARRDEREDPRD
jgi:hypothetical protein